MSVKTVNARRGAIFLASLLVAGAAIADDPYADCVKLTRSDPETDAMAQSSFWNAGGWDDGRFPHADTNYYVAADRNLMFCYASRSLPLSTNVWRGGELAIAGKLITEVSWSVGNSPVIPNLTLLGGSELMLRVLGPFAKSYGNIFTHVTVKSSLANPAVISSQFSSGSNLYLDFNVPFAGDEESALVLTRPLVNYKGQSLDAHVLFRMADDATFADFHGTLIVRGVNMHTDTGNGVCGPSLPNGTLRVEDGAQVVVHNGQVRTARTLPLKGFELDDGTLYISHGANCYFPTLVVTNTFTLGEHARFNMLLDTFNIRGLLPGETVARFSEPLAHLTGRAVESASVDSGFRVDFVSSAIPTNEISVGFLDNLDGSRDFCLYATNLVAMTNANVETTTQWVTQYGAFDGGHPEVFSDNQEPQANSTRHYVCTAKLCNFKNVSLPDACVTICENFSSKGGTLFRFKEINFTSGKEYGVWLTKSEKKSLEAEKIRILPVSQNEFRIFAYQDCTINVNAPIGGSTPLVLDNIGYSGTANLCGDNSGFHGKLTISQLANTASHYTDTPTAFRYKFKSVLKDARNFGGVYTGSDVHAAIEFSNWPWISVTNDVAFTEPTRTMRVTLGAKFDVAEGKNLVLSNQVTYAGHLVKDGLGTLELGGSARFGDGAASTAPTAGTNELEIAAGALKVTSETACDGLAITFAEGTRLIVPRNSEKGLYDVKWANPITVETLDGKLPVEVDFDASTEGGGDVVICTVSAAAAASLSPETFVSVRRTGGFALNATRKRVNADGSVSYVARFCKKGTRILIR